MEHSRGVSINSSLFLPWLFNVCVFFLMGFFPPILGSILTKTGRV